MNIFDKFFTKFSYKFDKGYPDMNNDQDVLLLESLISEVVGYKFKLSETALTPSVLSQTATLSRNNKVPRINILIDKIKNNQPLELEKSEETFIVFDPDGSKIKELENWDQSKGAVRLEDKDGNVITTSKLNKSSDFGGGKGSGGGATQTGIQESSQCAVSALVQKMGQITPEDLTPENIKSISDDIDTTSSIDEIIEFSEETPYNLIKDIKPNLIVKGGDYTIEEVVGHDLAPVYIVPTVKGHSTTDILKARDENTNNRS